MQKHSTLYNNMKSVTLHPESKTSEYGQEIPQSQTADQPTTPLGRATEH